MYENTPNRFSEIINPSDIILKKTERGYILVMTLFKMIGLSYNHFLLILGIITSLLLFTVIKDYTNYFFLVLFLFLCKGYLYYFFTAQRQIIAMLICWYAIKYIEKRKFGQFLFFVLIASFFHASAIVFTIVYFIYKMRLKNKTVLLLLFISIVMGVLHIGPFLMTTFSSFLPVSTEKLINYSGGTGSINVLNFIEMLPILFIVLKYRVIISQRTKNFPIFFSFFILYILINFAFYDFSIMVRLRGYFILGYIAIIASIPYAFKTSSEKIFAFMMMALYFSAVFIRELLVFDGGEGYLPYNSFLF